MLLRIREACYIRSFLHVLWDLESLAYASFFDCIEKLTDFIAASLEPIPCCVCNFHHIACHKRPLYPASALLMDLLGLIGVRDENGIRSRVGVKYADYLR